MALDHCSSVASTQAQLQTRETSAPWQGQWHMVFCVMQGVEEKKKIQLNKIAQMTKVNYSNIFNAASWNPTMGDSGKSFMCGEK